VISELADICILIALLSYADNVLFSACHIYVAAPMRSTTSTLMEIVTQAETITSTVIAATVTLTNTVSEVTTASSTISVSATTLLWAL